jgi:ribosomal protein S18 acetylase RimI-like enzyme
MSTSGITTRAATSADLDTVTELCVAAFDDEAVTTWIVPDPAQRRSYMRQLLSSSLEAVITTGGLILATDPVEGPVGASIWLPYTADAEGSVDSEGSASSEGSAHSESSAHSEGPAHSTARPQRVAVVEAAAQARHPAEPHLFLSSMATLPAHRGRGAGAAMLAAGLEWARVLDLPVYLEASTFDNRRLYERCGFYDLGETIDLPDGGPSLQPMWLAA